MQYFVTISAFELCRGSVYRFGFQVLGCGYPVHDRDAERQSLTTTSFARSDHIPMYHGYGITE
jgi:hypothetical protein